MCPPERAPAFRASADFLADYAVEALSADHKDLATWLFRFAGEMNQDIFSSRAWRELDATQVLILRACAPAGVFTDDMQSAYLLKVAGNRALTDLAVVLFSDDHRLVISLLNGMRSLIVTLMHLVYRKGIRPTDARVMKM